MADLNANNNKVNFLDIVKSITGGAVGGFTSFLGANAQQNFFNQTRGDVAEALSPQAIQARFQELLKSQGGFLLGRERDARIAGEAGATSAVAQFRRAGLTGVGEAVGGGIKAGVGIRARNARDAFKLELLKEARAAQESEARAMQSLLGTPFGGISPAAVTIGGAGAGLEAATNASFAEQLAGR